MNEGKAARAAALAAVICSGFYLGGCASISNGATERVAFVSDPSGASACTSRGDYCPATPCAFDLPRNEKFSVVFSKRGYHDGHAIVETFIANDRVGAQGNILFGFTPGAAVDAFDGGAYYHRPNPVSVTLAPMRAGGGAPKTAPKENPLLQMNKQPPPSIEDYLKNH